MVIKSAGTGSLAYSEIASEFGSPTNNNIGAYRVSQTVGGLSNLALDNSSNHVALIPQTGQIRFSDFYGKRLNMVVDFHSGGTVYRQVGKTRYDANAVTVIGGFKNKPKNPSGSRVFIHVNKFIGSAKGGSTTCALRTGSFPGTLLNVDVGGSGRILGAGGDGGQGADNQGKNGGNGTNGTSGLGVNQTTTVKVFSGGIISAGFGGGGGGGGAYDTDKFDDELASGGGGGGGAGLPTGSGGPGGNSWEADGSPGANASTFSRGGGGNGGDQGEAKGGKGGDGGQNGSGAKGGGSGSGEKASGGGSGGGDGFWLCSGGNSVSLLNSGSVRGSQTGSGGS